MSTSSIDPLVGWLLRSRVATVPGPRLGNSDGAPIYRHSTSMAPRRLPRVVSQRANGLLVATVAVATFLSVIVSSICVQAESSAPLARVRTACTDPRVGAQSSVRARCAVRVRVTVAHDRCDIDRSTAAALISRRSARRIRWLPPRAHGLDRRTPSGPVASRSTGGGAHPASPRCVRSPLPRATDWATNRRARGARGVVAGAAGASLHATSADSTRRRLWSRPTILVTPLGPVSCGYGTVRYSGGRHSVTVERSRLGRVRVTAGVHGLEGTA